MTDNGDSTAREGYSNPKTTESTIFNKLFFISAERYTDLVQLNDSIGFSIRRNYDTHLAYKPAIRSDGTPDNIAVIWVVLDTDKRRDDDIIPLNIRISNVSLSQLAAFNTNSDKPVSDMSLINQHSEGNSPIELYFKNEFSLNIKSQYIQSWEGRTLTGTELLDYVFSMHQYTVDPIFSIELKAKRFFIKRLVGILEFFQNLIIFIIANILKQDIKFHSKLLGTLEANSAFVHSPFVFSTVKVEKTILPKDQIFGFSFNKASIGILSFICVLIYFLNQEFNIQWTYFDGLKDNTLMITTHLFFGLILIEYLLDISRNPDGKTIKYLIKKFDVLREQKFELVTKDISPFSILTFLKLFPPKNGE